MATTLIKIAVSMFVPLLVGFLMSEIFGWDPRIHADALTQAVYEAFKQGSFGRIIVTILGGIAFYVMGNFSYRFADSHVASPAVIPLPRGHDEAFICSARMLSGQSFTGSTGPGQPDFILRVGDVRATEHGAEVRYAVVQGGDVRTDGRAFFDEATCTLQGIAALSPGAHIKQKGNDLYLVATEPRFELKRYPTR